MSVELGLTFFHERPERLGGMFSTNDSGMALGFQFDETTKRHGFSCQVVGLHRSQCGW